MSNSTPNIVATDTTPIAAPVLLGYMFNWALYGALSIQTYLYHVSFPQDRWPAKTLVYAIYAVETTQTILISHDAFNAYSIHFGDLQELNMMQNEWLAVPIFSAIVSCAVQMYYAYRVRTLSGSRIPQVVISVIALTQCIAGIVCGAQAFEIGAFSDLATRSTISTALWLTGCATCDVVIAGCMAYYLTRADTSFREALIMWVRFGRLVIETGTLTALVATVDLILYLTFPHSVYHACVALVLAKLYSNSLLVLLNAQIRIVGARNWAPLSLDKGSRAARPALRRSREGGAAGGSDSVIGIGIETGKSVQETPVVLDAGSAARELGAAGRFSEGGGDWEAEDAESRRSTNENKGL